MFFSKKTETKVIRTDHATRERVVKERHEAGVFQSGLRASLAGELSAEYHIPSGEAILTLPPGTVPGSQDVVSQGLGLAGRFDPGENNDDKIYLFRHQQRHEPSVLDTPLFRLALSRPIITTVAEYLGYIPILATAEFWLSPNVKHVDESRGPDTRLFHMDVADPSLVKVYIHCTDVSPDNGALVAYDPVTSSGIRDAINYNYRKKENRNTDLTRPDGQFVQEKFIESCYPADNPRVLSGPAGTVNLVDTGRCFHHGGRNRRTGVPRVLAMLLYLRPGALKLTYTHKDKPPFDYLAPFVENDMDRLVLGANVTD
jgi:hypothetical protein